MSIDRRQGCFWADKNEEILVPSRFKYSSIGSGGSVRRLLIGLYEKSKELNVEISWYSGKFGKFKCEKDPWFWETSKSNISASSI